MWTLNKILIAEYNMKLGLQLDVTYEKFLHIFAEKIYIDTQPLIRSVLDGFNVCIFAYGQTGSGKTYTMVSTKFIIFSIITRREGNLIMFLYILHKNRFLFSYRVAQI